MDEKRLTAVRIDGISYLACLMKAAESVSLVAEYDRLRGTDLSHRGAPINQMIDKASGKLDADLEGFLEFVWDSVYTRVPLGPVDRSGTEAP